MTPGTKLGFAAKRKNRSAKIFHEKIQFFLKMPNLCENSLKRLNRASIPMFFAEFLFVFAKKTKFRKKKFAKCERKFSHFFTKRLVCFKPRPNYMNWKGSWTT